MESRVRTAFALNHCCLIGQDEILEIGLVRKMVERDERDSVGRGGS